MKLSLFQILIEKVVANFGGTIEGGRSHPCLSTQIYTRVPSSTIRGWKCIWGLFCCMSVGFLLVRRYIERESHPSCISISTGQRAEVQRWACTHICSNKTTATTSQSAKKVDIKISMANVFRAHSRIYISQ